MKQYKLKKIYPGSPELGTMVILYPTYVTVDCNIFKGSISSFDVKNYPQFWEEVIENDYEILSFKHIGAIWKKDSQIKNAFCLVDGRIPFSYLSNIIKYNKPYEIYSIKRKSDGEIFSIGDKYKHHTIVGFKEVNDGCGLSAIYEIGHDYIKNLKKPLFITDDGVAVVEVNQMFFAIDKRNFICSECYIGSDIIVKKSKKFIYFSTKEKVEEYILLNKPYLSILEVQKSIFNIVGDKTFSQITNQLKIKVNK